VLYASLHADLYPGTGAAAEAGPADAAATGRNVNVMWPDPTRYPAASDGDYRAALDVLLLPIMRAFDPALVLVSAGFDAAAGARRINLLLSHPPITNGGLLE